jgi:predicted regulator of Ras-like GTPase activity (Roadblock/LC7/MglB family)
MNIQKLNACLENLKKDLGDGLVATSILSTMDGQLLVATENSNVTGATLLNEVTIFLREAVKTYPLELGRYYYIDISGNIGVLVIPFGDYQWAVSINTKKVKLGLLLNVILPAITNAFEDAIVS